MSASDFCMKYMNTLETNRGWVGAHKSERLCMCMMSIFI